MGRKALIMDSSIMRAHLVLLNLLLYTCTIRQDRALCDDAIRLEDT